jgi:hypothetical protein
VQTKQVHDITLCDPPPPSRDLFRPVSPPNAGRCLHTVQHHTDYVTSLAASEASGKLFSAGLHSEVIMYDMQVSGCGRTQVATRLQRQAC